MRILILGAGATGGYFGGRLANAGADVTFLVRPKRAEALAAAPLEIESPLGNLKLTVKTTTAETVRPDYDVVILSCKSYDLESAISALRPAMAPTTLIVPLLNGMSHLASLDDAFGAECILGGCCQISITLRPDGTIHHMSDFDILTLGPRSEAQSDRCSTLASVLQRGGFEVRHSSDVIQAMWDKWVVLATLAAMTTLMRAHTGEIARTKNGASLMSATLDECFAIAKAHGFPTADARIAEMRAMLTDPATPISASMRRDLEAGRPVEADHIIGDLIARGRDRGVPSPLLEIAYTALEAYQNRLRDRS